ncbi:hypothetical protein K3555_23620 (plasmid) [Leisingera sp. M527]|uniref:hypothetical protein n=1 Tax=Leisingera sp. M527 TaxID=2867014 RepID=UPI0021A52AF3|nr:hypothetical protein [Leisingera sp. M527]UWQ35487.1 hypothetical protein K3555_23620 [Leisingera sp. M527]
MRNFNSAHEKDLEVLSSFLKVEAINSLNFNDALICAGLYGRLHWDNISGFFGDDGFEKELFAKWKHKLPRLSAKEMRGGRPDRWCHVLTRVYSYGGHSRLFKQLCNGLADHGISQSLIVTQKATADVLRALPDHLDAKSVLKGTPEHRACAVYKIARTASTVLLYNHPDDIGTALAARALREDGVKVLFVNHADHVFSFGPGAADTVLEICATGWATSEQRRSTNAQHFMGIPMVSASADKIATRYNRSGPILSIGGPAKYKPTSSLNFPRFLEQLLAVVSNDVVLIGPSKKDPWWADVLAKYPGRIQLLGIQPSEVVQTEFQRASCYVDSFPMDGGTVFSEAVLNGLPTFGPNRQSALGISPADSLRCEGETQLISDVAAYLKGGECSLDLVAVRNRIHQDFTNLAAVERVLEAAAGVTKALPDYLTQLGNRGPDYNAHNWRQDAQLHFPKRAWRKLSLRKKLKIWRSASHLDLSTSTVKKLKHRIFFG